MIFKHLEGGWEGQNESVPYIYKRKKQMGKKMDPGQTRLGKK